MITDKQCVVTTNGPFANRNHRDTLVNIYRQIHNFGWIDNPLECISIENNVQKNYIIGRLVNDPEELGVYAVFPIASITPNYRYSNYFMKNIIMCLKKYQKE